MHGTDRPEKNWETALSDERGVTDHERRDERALLDSTVETLRQASASTRDTRRLLRAISERIQSQRLQADELRSDARRSTDSIIDEERRTDEVTERGRTHELDAMRRELKDRSQALCLVMAELDVIVTATQSIRVRAVDLPQAHQDHLFALAAAIEVSTERVLDLVGELLDPDDNRGLHHDLGGESG